ncbi:phage tail length tape measure family protein [Acidovorax sp. sif1233]|uniref:phage tail length tape measure family protein n=1 Tax=Acidovorax sp. sif1233 TaxID=2854792 RepID=UPI001C48B1A6|nr:phage tail length tape measure family protein [Acidovorax sp. sif1233]MBV7454305.1 phage tail length tape measure family protein [Acidovorax sp. sif1233]
MSVNGKLILAVKMLLERGQYKADLNQAVADTQDAATRIEGGTRGIADAVQEVVGGQSAAVNAASRALTVLGPAAAAAAAAALAVGVAYHQAHQETLGYEKAIILSGNAAAVTSGQLGDMARSIDGVVGTQANAAATLTAMTASGEVARENLEKVSLAAIEMERAAGQSVSETAKLFSSLGDEPVKASLRLNESMHYLTASTYAQIKAADDLGDKETAASVAQNALADALRDRAAKIEQSLGILERSWRSVRDLAKEAWDAMVGIGRPDTLAQQRERNDSQVASLQKQIDGRKERGLATGDLDGQLAAAQALQQTLRETAKLDDRAAQTKRELAAQDAARIDLAQALEQSASKQVKLAQEVAKANALADRAGASAAEREQLVNAAREKYAEKAGRAGGKTGLSEAEREAASIANLSGLTSDYQQKLTELQSAREKGNLSEERYIELVEALIAKQPMARKLMDDQAKATTAAEKATLELAKARDKDLASTQAAIEKARAAVTAQEEQNARLGLTKEAIADLDAAKLEMLATDLELQAIQQMDKNLDEQRYDLLKQQAQAYRDLAKAKRDGAAKQAGIDAQAELAKEADKVAVEGQRAAERIEQTLTDSLMRGFEAGKDGAQNLVDTVKNLFKTLVLRPTISAIMSPVAAGINGILGGIFGGGGGAGGGVGLGGLANGANAVSNLWGMGTSAAGWVGSGVGALFGQTAGNAALGASLGLGAGSSAAAASGAALAGGGSAAGAGLGASIGAAIPYVGLALAALSLFGGMDDSGTFHTGSSSQYSARGGMEHSTAHGAFGTGFGAVDYSKQTQDFTGAMAKGIVTMLDSTATTFGKEAGYKAATAFADDTSEDGAWGALLITKLEDTIVNWDLDRTSKWAPKEFADGAQGREEYLAAVAADVQDELVNVVDDWAKPMIEALGDGVSLEQLAATVEQINAAKAVFVDFGKLMPAFADMADSAIAKLAEASGGAGPLAANMQAFANRYYSDDERLAMQASKLEAEFEKLGVEMPETTREFRELVEAQIALGDEGAETAAALLGLSDAFADVAEASGGMGDALAGTTTAMVDTFGITADAIKGILDNAIENANSAEEAAQMASESFEEMIYSNINDAMTTGLSSMIMGAIQPMVDGLIAGATASGGALASGGAAGGGAMAAGGAAGGGAVAGGGAAAGGAVAAGGAGAAGAMVGGGVAVGQMVNTAIEQARVSLAAWAEVLKDPAVQGMITDISGLVGGVAGVAYQASGGASASGGGSDFKSPGSFNGPAGAADDLTDALESLGDAIEDEVKRLRGLMTENSSASQEALMAKFATETAKARAGDKNALELLPSLSKDIESAAEKTATSAVDIALMRGWLANSLTTTLSKLGLDVPAFDVGTNYVPRDMLALIHEGEAIVPKAYNPAANPNPVVGFAPHLQGLSPGDGALQELLAEFRGLRSDFGQFVKNRSLNQGHEQGLRARILEAVENVEELVAMAQQKTGVPA